MTEVEEPERYCRSCLHSLRTIVSRKCPECGREFDPGDLRTTLAHPHREFWDRLAFVARVLIRTSIVVAIVAFVASVLGFDRPRMPWTPVFLLGAAAFVVFVFALAAFPKVPLSRRFRAAGIIFPFLFVSIDWTRWPLYVALWVCPPWLESVADQVQARAITTIPSPRSELWCIQRGEALSNGNVGFQLVGGNGGGIYLVRRAGDAGWLPLPGPRVWYNTNWEKSLGGEWYLVLED